MATLCWSWEAQELCHAASQLREGADDGLPTGKPPETATELCEREIALLALLNTAAGAGAATTDATAASLAAAAGVFAAASGVAAAFAAGAIDALGTEKVTATAAAAVADPAAWLGSNTKTPPAPITSAVPSGKA